LSSAITAIINLLFSKDGKSFAEFLLDEEKRKKKKGRLQNYKNKATLATTLAHRPAPQLCTAPAARKTNYKPSVHMRKGQSLK